MPNRQSFISAMLPHAIDAIGKQHHFFVRWALAKAGLECGWRLDNELIVQANNCLGIKWPGIDSVPWVRLSANTGPESGEPTKWRRFGSLRECFGEFARILNDRAPYQPARNLMLVAFENVYTNGLKGHAEQVIVLEHAVLADLQNLGMANERGQLR